MTGSKPTRVALVTGAAQGIGKSIALQLASDGLDVAVNDIASKSSLLDGVVQDIKGKGRRAIAIPADVRNEDEVRMMVQAVVRDLGKLDVVRVVVSGLVLN
jgi:NAD(P)-dependent dehydrogenase (short-subunit alcohol dehydrogenase family)